MDAPANPPAAPPAEQLEDDAPQVQINFPAFDVFLERQQNNGKVVRSITDKTHDFAQVRDVHHVANYAAHCAALAVSTYSGIMHPVYTGQIQHLANTVAWAIAESIAEAEHQRKHRAWFRVLWRRIRRSPIPERPRTSLAAIAQLGEPQRPAEP